MKSLKTSLLKQGPPVGSLGFLQRASRTLGGVPDTDDSPDISGMTSHAQDQFIAVRDSKFYQWRSSPLGLVNKENGDYTPLKLDSNGHSKPFDLEAVAKVGENRYAAVEGTRIFGRSPKLMIFKVDGDQATTEVSYALPKLEQEIEGMLIGEPSEDGSQKVILAGRSLPAKLYWGKLDNEGLHFEEEGLAGVEVESPDLDGDHRGLTELTTDSDGTIWASSAVERWSGENTSTIRSIGKFEPEADRPFTLEPGEAFLLEGTKVEGLGFHDGNLMMAGDNEEFGGRIERVDTF